MTDQNDDVRRRVITMVNSRTFWAALAIAGVSGIIAANAHLVMVAVRSQPNCVPHQKEPAEKSGEFRAASSSCTWQGEAKE